MTVFQWILLALIVIVFYKIYQRYREKVISNREMLFWSVIWVVAGLLTIWPGTTSFLASTVGIGRGVDLVVYLALILILYLIFKLIVRVEKLERNLTEIVRHQAVSRPINHDTSNRNNHSQL
ncbi:DUF2304 domain-containing protein [Candidatus Uhrbacteria bacterium]|nr:DUF2304 domain-containing protein [Candidatus Uhrbacteria bacterium]